MQATAMTNAQRSLVDQIVSSLASIPCVSAVVLGGSHARERARPDSDIDIGLYYHDADPFAISAISELARCLDDSGDPVVSGFGEWGRWVDGGAWLTIGGQRVDLLYRSVDKVEATLADARAGRFEIDTAQQPPYGFFGPTLLGEVAIAQPLFDPAGLLTRLKAAVQPMPEALRRAVIQQCLWSTNFGLRAFAPKYVTAGNSWGAAACFTRFAGEFVLALFALNGAYLINDKTALAEITDFPQTVPGFASRISAIVGHAGTDAAQLRQSMHEMSALFEAVCALAGDHYRPAWRI